jgi:hypothetical protein
MIVMPGFLHKEALNIAVLVGGHEISSRSLRTATLQVNDSTPASPLVLSATHTMQTASTVADRAPATPSFIRRGVLHCGGSSLLSW